MHLRKYNILLLTMLIILVFTGCVYKQGPEDLPSSGEIMDQFDTIAARDIVGVSHIVDFMDKNIDLVDAKHASGMILKLEDKQKEYLFVLEQTFYTEEMQDKFQEEDDFEKNLNDPEELSDPDLKEFVEGILRDGFKIGRAEGSYFPIVNYSYYDKYDRYATPEIGEYLALMRVESEQASMADGALIVSWEEVIRRALAQEAFLVAYPESVKAKDVAVLFDRYRNALLNGLPNTPIFDYDKNILKAEVRSAFENALKEDRESELLDMLASFMEVLGDGGYQMTKEVKAFLADQAE